MAVDVMCRMAAMAAGHCAKSLRIPWVSRARRLHKTSLRMRCMSEKSCLMSCKEWEVSSSFKLEKAIVSALATSVRLIS